MAQHRRRAVSSDVGIEGSSIVQISALMLHGMRAGARPWPQNPHGVDEYKAGLKISKVDPKNPVARLLRQVESGNKRGRKVYVAISDGISMRSRGRLLEYLDAAGVPEKQVLLLPESEILRIGKVLREHMAIPQPTFPAKGGD